MKHEGSPSISTKNALAVLVGYQNWKDFVMQHSRQNVSSRFKGKKLLLSLFILTLFLLIGMLLFTRLFDIQKYTSKTIDTSNVNFSVREKSGEVPFSVIFDYDVSEIDADSVWIRHGWNPKDVLDKDKKVRTILHFIPNYYCPELIADGQKIAEACYHATTPGWIFLFPYSSWEPRFYKQMNTTRGYLHITPEVLKENNINIADENHWVIYHLSKDFGVSGHDFILETSIMNPIDSGGFTCQEGEIELCFENINAAVVFTHKNCIKNARFNIGDIEKKCINYDLSELGVNMNEWNPVSLAVSSDTFRVKKGPITIIEEIFTSSPGGVKAIKFHFRGTGMVDYVNLLNGNGDTIYVNGF